MEIADRTRYLLVPLLAGVLSCTGAESTDTSRAERPNILVILADDLGYGDIGAYGAEGFETPNLDRLAAEGMRFTSFYVPANVCTPSRAALLTGRYPMRVGLPSVLFPRSTTGLNPEELTIAELLGRSGYATSAIGKWHLGAHPEFLPTNHGFDEFFGLPYSNDMSPDPDNNPTPAGREFPPLPLLEDTMVVEREPDQAELTARYTDRAIEFIERNRDRPFFLYVAHHAPHVPLHPGAKYRGTAERGPYGDVLQEIDGMVGDLLDALEQRDLRKRTLVFFTSDNGPWLLYGDHAGSSGHLREGKGTTFEGGHRVPAIVSWPGHIAPGRVTDVVSTTMDLLPTAARLAGASIPGYRIIDGHDISPILADETAEASPYDVLYFYAGEQLQAVREGQWKLHAPHTYQAVEPGTGRYPGRIVVKEIPLSLFNLDDDPAERENVADEHPEIVERLLGMIEVGRSELGDVGTGTMGSHQGEPGQVEAVWEEIAVD